MTVTHRIDMDLVRWQEQPPVTVMHNDKFSRELQFRLLANGVAYQPPEGCTVLVRYEKPSGGTGAYDTLPDGTQAWCFSKNILTVALAPAVCSEPGGVILAVALLFRNAELNCFTVRLEVKEGVGDGAAVAEYVNITAFLPQPEDAAPGRFLRIAETDEQGRAAQLEAVELSHDQLTRRDAPDQHTIAAITGLEAALAVLGQGGTATDAAYTVPDFWTDAVDAAAEKVLALQDAGGRDCVTFAWFSDNHQRLGYAGHLIAAMMDKCGIPYSFYCGDGVSSGYIADEETMISQAKAFDAIMSPVPARRDCRTVGNHDGYWSPSSGVKYHQSWEQIYNLFFRSQSLAQNRDFGGDGSYFYVEDSASRVRFIVLNSMWSAFSIGTDGTMTNADGYGFGQEQADWLMNTALHFDEPGWAVALFSHAPITNDGHSALRDARIIQGILTAFAGGTTYEGAYLSTTNAGHSVSVSADFSESIPADLIGWFAGHVHVDTIGCVDSTTSSATPVTLPFYTVTITSDADLDYGESPAVRDPEGDTSHAIDFVTVNRRTHTVYLTRLGVGSDRSFVYSVRAAYTNLLSAAVDPSSTGIFNSTGYLDGKYVSGAGLGTDENAFATGLIPYSVTDSGLPGTIYIRASGTIYGNSHVRLQCWTEDKVYLNQVTFMDAGTMGQESSIDTYFTLEALDDQTRRLTPVADGTASKLYSYMGQAGYIRLSLPGSGADCIITVDELIP